MQPDRCRAKRRDGKPCGNRPMAGQSVCRMHGGSSPQARAKAAERLAEHRARRTLAELEQVDPVTDPFAALEGLAGQAVALVDVLRDQVSQLQEVRYRGGPGSGTEQLRAELSAYLTALGRAESILGRVVSLDLDARRVRLQEAQVAAVVVALDNVLASPAMALDAERQRRGRELLARALGAPGTVTMPRTDQQVIDVGGGPVKRKLRPRKDPQHLDARPALADLRPVADVLEPSGNLAAAQTFRRKLSHERDHFLLGPVGYESFPSARQPNGGRPPP